MGEVCRHVVAGRRLMHTATGFSLPFLLAGEPPSTVVRDIGTKLTALLLQSGKPRRTNRRNLLQRDSGFRARQGQSVCRILGGAWGDCIDITASISLPVAQLLKHELNPVVLTRCTMAGCVGRATLQCASRIYPSRGWLKHEAAGDTNARRMHNDCPAPMRLNGSSARNTFDVGCDDVTHDRSVEARR